MSYSYDVMASAWESFRAQLPQLVRDGEAATRMGLLIGAMHEANHAVDDKVNHAGPVRTQAARMAEALDREARAWAEQAVDAERISCARCSAPILMASPVCAGGHVWVLR